MSTPKGMCTHTISLACGDQVQVYSNPEHIYLQLRRLVPTEQDIPLPSFNVAVELSSLEALRLSSELLQLASAHLITSKPPSPDVSLWAVLERPSTTFDNAAIEWVSDFVVQLMQKEQSAVLQRIINRRVLG